MDYLGLLALLPSCQEDLIGEGTALRPGISVAVQCDFQDWSCLREDLAQC